MRAHDIEKFRFEPIFDFGFETLGYLNRIQNAFGRGIFTEILIFTPLKNF